MRLLNAIKARSLIPADEHFSDVVLLLNCNGADGSTTFTDDSDSGHTVTANGDAQVDTAEKKFGSGSALFDGTGDYLSIPDHADFDLGNSDFTIEFWLWPDTSTAGLVSKTDKVYTGTNSDVSYLIRQYGADNLLVMFSTDGSAATRSYNTTNDPLSADAWNHVALERHGTTFRLYVNGTTYIVWSSSATLYNSSQDLIIGAEGATTPGYYCDGQIDDIRFTNGTARYQGTCVPPTYQNPAY